jgi:FKBP-type peptidyl-prolyl cis-trans isomerase
MKITTLLIGITVLFLASCNSGKTKFKKHESGLEYIIVDQNSSSSVKPVIGDVLVLNMSYEKEDGTVLFSSANSDRKYLRTLALPSHEGGSFEDGLALLNVGDSAVFRINAESFLKNSETLSKLPKGIGPEDLLIIKVRLVEILEKSEFDEHLVEKYHQSEEAEMEVLKKYLQNSNITVAPTPSGLYFVEQVKGTGKQPQINDVVSVHYTVKLIDGLVIETSLDKEPITFKLGTNQVVKAWDEGITKMRVGGKAIIIAPSKIAYGEKGQGDILPYSTLVFEVELISIQ